MRTTLLLLALLSLVPVAEASDCGGLNELRTSAPLVYPPIAKAAHISGSVIALVNFTTRGVVSEVNILSGAYMLQQTSRDYLRSWVVNEFSGPRTCAVVLSFDLRPLGCDQPISQVGQSRPVLIDPQHVRVEGFTYETCDPTYTITTHG